MRISRKNFILAVGTVGITNLIILIAFNRNSTFSIPAYAQPNRIQIHQSQDVKTMDANEGNRKIVGNKRQSRDRSKLKSLKGKG